MSALTTSIAKLQQEKQQLQKDKDELQAKLAAKMATKGRLLIFLYRFRSCIFVKPQE